MSLGGDRKKLEDLQGLVYAAQAELATVNEGAKRVRARLTAALEAFERDGGSCDGAACSALAHTVRYVIGLEEYPEAR